MINEIGTLRALPNGESSFVGSSSGVFFINTVRRAFSQAAVTASRQSPSNNETQHLADLPSPEDCILDPGSNDGAESPSRRAYGSNHLSPAELPGHATAKELLMTYFQTWHPLLPFIHGPSCLEELEAMYSHRTSSHARKPPSLGVAILFRCLFNIAKVDRPDLPPLGRCRIDSEEQLLIALVPFSLKRDLASIQALLAVQLYFVATMSLQAASSAGGLVLRSVFKAGLHRCPFRYSTLSDDDRDIRKRIFWSAYTLDRYISQSLGHPLGIQDSDIDVCSPGVNELHKPVSSLNVVEEGTSPEESILHLPANHPQRQYISSQSRGDDRQAITDVEPVQPLDEPNTPEPHSLGKDSSTDSMSHRRQQNQSVQAQVVRYSQLLGRLVETFHKSIHARTASRANILFLKADIDAWGNDMPYLSNEFSGSNRSIESALPTGSLNKEVFFAVAQQQLLLLVNRPSLSLESSSAEFRHAVQLCIKTARSIIRTLDIYSKSQGTLFWPGFMSAAWMSGLVLVFACQLKLHNVSNGINDIQASLRILGVMKQRWKMAHNCCEVLSMLLESIQNPVASSTTGRSKRSSSQVQNTAPSTKRRRNDQTLMRTPVNHQNSSSSARSGPQISSSFPPPGIPDLRHQVNVPGLNIPENSSPRQVVSGVEDSNIGSSSAAQADQFPNGPQDELPNITAFSTPQLHETRNGESFTFTQSYYGMLDISTNLDTAAYYDVFDGAMWGSLLDLVEQNE